MLKCSNNNCCMEFSDADISAQWKKFAANICPSCGSQVGWDINVDDYKPAPAPVKVAPKKAKPKKAAAKKTTTKKRTAKKK